VPVSESVASIRQIPGADRLPDFRNLGVLARILLIACAVGLTVAATRARSLQDFLVEVIDLSGQAQPVLILSLLALVVLSEPLRRLPYRIGIAAVFVLALATATLAHQLERTLLGETAGPIERYWLFSAIVTGVLLAYFHLRGRALSPALAEARLQALQARIRPPFLFNSMNAVLSLIRADPKRAETALEDLAELFRVLMADNRELAPIAREIELCRQYLALEELRLGERLRVEWHIERMPEDALIPPLVLQPLLENAVYHGIEPRTEPGTVSIDIYRKGSEVHAVLRNPYQPAADHHAGNKMALANIRERLQLHFDAEASLKTTVDERSYLVHIVVPYRRLEA